MKKINAVFDTILRALRLPRKPDHKAIFEAQISHLPDLKTRFTEIYKINMWGAEDGITETVSGPGSTLSHTAGIRRSMPALFQKHGIQSVLDAGCGDFHWMRQVVAESNVRYIGVDVVEELIASNNAKYSTDKIEFVSLDITQDDLPGVDLVICRECLFHLSNDEIADFFRNFLRSQSTYLLTTTYGDTASIRNRDVTTGFFRELDLVAEPFNLPHNVIAGFDDTSEGKPKRRLCLWSREQLQPLFGEKVNPRES